MFSEFNYVFSLLQYHRGRSPQTEQWVFGIVDISTRPATGYMQLVDRRNTATLLPIIQQHVQPEYIQMSGQPTLEYLQLDIPIQL